MQGVSEPSLLVKGAGSPHTYSLKPSQAKELQEADIVFWMSHDLEAFLENSIESIAKNAKVVSLMDSHGLMEATTLTSAVATAVDMNKKVDASKADLTARIKFSIEQKLTMENLCYNIT